MASANLAPSAKESLLIRPGEVVGKDHPLKVSLGEELLTQEVSALELVHREDSKGLAEVAGTKDLNSNNLRAAFSANKETR